MMKTLLSILLATTVGILFGLGIGCGEPTRECSPANCVSGCCDSDGVCQPGITQQACGMSASQCVACTGAQICSGGACIEVQVKTDGGTGKSDGGGTADAGGNDIDGGGNIDGGGSDGGGNIDGGGNTDGGGGTDGGGNTDGGGKIDGGGQFDGGGGADGGQDGGCTPDGTFCTSHGGCCSGTCNLSTYTCGALPPRPGESCANPSTLSFNPSGSSFVAYDTASTLGYTNDTLGSCGGNGADRVYQVPMPVAGSITVSVTAQGGQAPVAFLRGVSCGAPTDLACATGTSGGSATFTYPNAAAGTYYLWVSWTNGAAGNYALTVTVTPTPVGVPGDSCASPIPMSFDTAGRMSVGATTIGAASDIGTLFSGCTSASGADVFFAFNNATRSDFTATVTGLTSGYQPTVYLRQTCTSQTLICASSTTGVGTASVSYLDLPAGTYYLVVDGANSTEGAFNLEARVTAPGAEALSCASPKPLILSGSGPFTAAVSADTEGGGDDHASSCVFPIWASAPDHVYSFSIATPGTVSAKLRSVDNLGLALNHAPCSTGAEITCRDAADDDGGVNTETLPIRSVDAGTYYLWVDGYFMGSGPYELSVTVQ